MSDKKIPAHLSGAFDTDSLIAKPLNEEEDGGPCAWVFRLPVAALDIEDGAKPVLTFHYEYISVMAIYSPGEFTIWFIGKEHWKLTVRGTNLRPIYNKINERRVRRISVSDRQFDDKTPFISFAHAEQVTPSN